MQNDDSKEQAPWWQPGLILFSKLSGWVAGPILLSIFVGKSLDNHFNTAPWIFLGLTATAFIVSTFALVHTYSQELKRIETEESKAKEQETLDKSAPDKPTTVNQMMEDEENLKKSNNQKR